MSIKDELKQFEEKFIMADGITSRWSKNDGLSLYDWLTQSYKRIQEDTLQEVLDAVELKRVNGHMPLGSEDIEELINKLKHEK